MSILVLATVAWSAAMIVLLWRGDPKRLRVINHAGEGNSAASRRLLVVAALLPGVAIAVRGDSAAFLMWFGSCALAGWIAAQLPDRGTAGSD